MNLSDNKINFSDLLSPTEASSLLQQLIQLGSQTKNVPNNRLCLDKDEDLKELRSQWQELSITQFDNTHTAELIIDSERLATDWLIQLFNTLFANQQVILARSDGEPEYFPAQNDKSARIEFAHGFFASALHEISHWCVAGNARRQLSDFGYWYAPDGRSAAQQQAFERVEIKPQALECLFTLACGRNFQVSQDNLFADFDTSSSTFASDVYQQVQSYITKPHTLPRDAKTLLTALLSACTSSSEINA
ncbi:elongation factor P hydroxylase [Psychrobacter proteolyticus]|uniref:elongation factor P hydroxylase n=1 Tax=Psychrobacter proteolyticus TaxID=147825 RepID=UPI000E0C1C85|nr:elongation factor P hydroxylase [Psychrobacter proteolyticus]